MDELLKALAGKLDLKDLWEKNKLFFLILIPIIVLIKFRDVFINLLVKGAKREVDQTQQQDATLAKKEDQANAQANQLVQDANQLGENKPTVDENWYKKND